MISFVALTIDTLLPAYGEIKVYYDVEDAQLHWIITCLFIGFSFGQIIFGPLSDRLGRQNSIIIGVSIYIVGCIICLTSSSYTFFVIGRLIQGLGIGGPRVVSQAICRDLFSGNKLASINSFIMSIFILIPIVAPLGLDNNKKTYNINGDSAANAIAKKLQSRRLLLMTNVEGVYDDKKNLISEIKPFDLENLIKWKVVQGGMIPKIENCVDAVENGVRGVVILDGRKPHSILHEIFSDIGSGTLIRK